VSIQWALVLFTAISGLGAWLFVCVGIDEFLGRTKDSSIPSSIVALLAIVVGAALSITHLSHPTRVLNALSHPTSGIFTEALLAGLLAVVIVIFIVAIRRDASARVRKVLAVTGIVLGVVFSFACGHSYIMASRAAWDTLTLPCVYLGTAAATGTATYLLICSLRKEARPAIAIAAVETVVGGALALVTALVYGLTVGAVTGSSAPLFWAGVILCGGIVPLIGGLTALRKDDAAGSAAILACTGAIIGSVAFRALMWLLGTAHLNFFGITL
jgi:DMSO reductase anchor subunit